MGLGVLSVMVFVWGKLFVVGLVMYVSDFGVEYEFREGYIWKYLYGCMVLGFVEWLGVGGDVFVCW